MIWSCWTGFMALPLLQGKRGEGEKKRGKPRGGDRGCKYFCLSERRGGRKKEKRKKKKGGAST